MAYVPPEYPGGIPEFAEIWPAVDDVNWMFTAAWDAMVKELRAIMAELGTDPAGTFATVKARFDAILPHFVDRGDPATSDFVVGNFTTDGFWHELDLSSIVPAGAKGVQLYGYIQDDLINQFMQFRKNGNTNTINAPFQYTQVANQIIGFNPIVACDTNRVIEYIAANITWTTLTFVVGGWWK